MARTFSFQVDAEMGSLIDHDIARLSQETGQDMTPSQYFRYVMSTVLTTGRQPVELGWQEGFKAGYADVRKAFETAVYDLAKNPPRVVE